MKGFKFIIFLSIGFLLPQSSNSQDTESISFVEKTEFIGKIYSNFRADLNNINNKSFNVTRAYLGFETEIAPYYKIILKLDIGSPEDLSDFSRIKRYAYFKNAGLVYAKDNLSLSFGIIDMFQFKIQEKFWDHRYLYKSFMDEHRFSTSADIGGRIEYRLNYWLSGDLTISNGEGYAKIQMDNSFKTGFGTTINASKHLKFRLYYDYMNKNETTQSTVSFFSGLIIQKFKIGGDVNMVINATNESNQNKWGYSVYSMYKLKKRWEVFVRYDMLSSTKLEGEDYGWNYSQDGSALIAGIQFQPIPKINIALNYQDWYPYPQNLDNDSYIYIHFEFKL